MPNYMTELSPDNNAHVYQIKDKEAAPIDLLKDTVGWVGKNILNIKDGTATQPTQVYYENDTIKVVGGTWANFNTPTIKFSKAESLVFSVNVAVTSGTLNYAIVKNGSNVVEDNFTESTSKNVSLQVSANDEILVRFRSPNNGVGVFSNIMLRDASIIDDTYEPYHKSVEEVVEQVYADNGILGAHQWLDISKDPIVNRTTLTVSGHSIRIQATNQTWSSVSYNLTNLPKNINFNLRFNAIITSGVGLVAFRGKVAGGSEVVFRERSVSGGAFDAEFNTSNYDEIKIGFYCTNGTVTTGDITFENVLLKLASDMSNDVTDYSETNQQLTQSKFDRAEQMVLGAKNLLKYPYGNTTKTENNVTFIDNGDGTITANTSAAASANTSFMLAMAFVYGLNKDAVLSGIPSGTSSTICDIFLWDETASKGYYDYGDGVLIPASISGHRVNIVFRVKNGQTVSNLTIKPMLRLASDPDDTYVPYAMTNRELTDAMQVQDILSELTIGAGVLDANSFAKKCGNQIFMSIKITGLTATAYSTGIVNIPKKYAPPKSSVIYGRIGGVGIKDLGLNVGSNTCDITCFENIENKTLIIGLVSWITD